MEQRPRTPSRQESGLPTPSELRAAAALLEREVFASVAGVLRLAAAGQEAVDAHLARPGGMPFGRLTDALPGLLTALLGRLPLFYSPTVAALLSLLGSRRAEGEREAFDEVAKILSPNATIEPGRGKRGRGPVPLPDRERRRADLAHFDVLVSDFRRMRRTTKGLKGAAEILAACSDFAPRPELAVALAHARTRRSLLSETSDERRLVAWAWSRTRGTAGETYAVKIDPTVTFDEKDRTPEKELGNLIQNARRASGKANKKPPREVSGGPTFGIVEDTRERASKRPKGEIDAGTRHHEPRARRPVRVEAPDGAREPNQGADPALREGRKPNPVPGRRRPGVGERPSLHVDRRRAGPPRERLKPP